MTYEETKLCIARKLILVDGRIEVVFIIDSRGHAHLHGSLFQELHTDVELHLRFGITRVLGRGKGFIRAWRGDVSVDVNAECDADVLCLWSQ